MRKIITSCLFFILVGAPVFSSEKIERFADDGSGTVTDTVSNLMWAKSPNFLVDHCKDNEKDPACGLLISKEVGLLTWGKAQMAASMVSFAGYNDWRLPTREEVMIFGQIQKGELKNPFGVIMGLYWTSTPGEKANTYWTVTPASGIEAYIKKDSVGYLWPVRDTEN